MNSVRDEKHSVFRLMFKSSAQKQYNSGSTNTLQYNILHYSTGKYTINSGTHLLNKGFPQ